MPHQQIGSKKRSQAQKEQLALVHAKHANSDTPEPSVESLKSSLGSTHKELKSTNVHLKKAQDQIQTLEEKSKDLYSTLHAERRKIQCTTAQKLLLEKQIKLLKSIELPSVKGDAARAIQLLEETKSENIHLESSVTNICFPFLSRAYHLTCPMIYDTLCLPYLSLTHLSRNPFGSTINLLCTSTPMLTDTRTYPQHATLSPLDSYHSDIPILFLVFLLDDMSYLS